MRRMLVAACAAGVLLAAGSAEAFTVVDSGTASDFFAELPGLEQNTTYYIQLVTDIPWQDHDSSLYLNYRLTRYVDGIDGIAIRFNSATFITPTPTDYGFKAMITTPADSYVDITRTVFDRMAIYFYAVVREQDTPPDMPWSMTVSSDPIAPPPGAVPEPATWAMMILGFGLTGAALRRRPLRAG